jgi:hypothetical protein
VQDVGHITLIHTFENLWITHREKFHTVFQSIVQCWYLTGTTENGNHHPTCCIGTT